VTQAHKPLSLRPKMGLSWAKKEDISHMDIPELQYHFKKAFLSEIERDNKEWNPVVQSFERFRTMLVIVWIGCNGGFISVVTNLQLERSFMGE
jgi:hypothetical protein